MGFASEYVLFERWRAFRAADRYPLGLKAR